MDILNELLSSINEDSVDKLAKKAVVSWASESEEDSDILLSSALVFRNHKFCFKSATLDYPYFETTYDLVKGEEELGLYKIYTDLHGEPVDDHYQIYKTV